MTPLQLLNAALLDDPRDEAACNAMVDELMEVNGLSREDADLHVWAVVSKVWSTRQLSAAATLIRHRGRWRDAAYNCISESIRGVQPALYSVVIVDGLESPRILPPPAATVLPDRDWGVLLTVGAHWLCREVRDRAVRVRWKVPKWLARALPAPTW